MTAVNFQSLANFIWSVADLLRGPDNETAVQLSIHRLMECNVVFGRCGELGRCGVVDKNQLSGYAE